MPVSRKRNRGRKSQPTRVSPARRAVQNQPRRGSTGSNLARVAAELTDLHRQRITHEASSAAGAARAMIAELVELAPARSDAELEAELCARLGSRLVDLENAPLDEAVSADAFGLATAAAAAKAVQEHAKAQEHAEAGQEQADRDHRRVLAAVGRVLPTDVTANPTDTPQIAGDPLWTRDVHGSRFGIVAPFKTPGGETRRWYLWDVDTCVHAPVTVHSAYYPAPEDALAAWQAGVGEFAAAGTTFAQVDDRSLLAEILPRSPDFNRPSGEDEAQFAEYHRSRRLAEAVRSALPRTDDIAIPDLGVDLAKEQFVGWLERRGSSRPESPDFDELLEELADSWHIDQPRALYETFSPHKVAMLVAHLRDYYVEDAADDLIGLLPEWIEWLAERTGAPREVVERCRPYAKGEIHSTVGGDASRPNYMARVTE